MQVPLQIAYRNVEKRDEIENLVNEQVARLEKVCDHVDSCRVVIEKPNENVRKGSGYRVRIDMMVPPSHEIVASREAGEGDINDDLSTVIRAAFNAARKRLQKLDQKQRGDVKNHPQQNVMGEVTKKMEDYGFLRAVDGREIYFHAHSVLSPGFDSIKIGTGVAFTEEMGNDGPQASSVHIVERRGEGPTANVQ